jgi:hypothetical protein
MVLSDLLLGHCVATRQAATVAVVGVGVGVGWEVVATTWDEGLGRAIAGLRPIHTLCTE